MVCGEPLGALDHGLSRRLSGFLQFVWLMKKDSCLAGRKRDTKEKKGHHTYLPVN